MLVRGLRSPGDAMLINEHTKSAAEMIADFAATNQLATLVGTGTAGEVAGQ